MHIFQGLAGLARRLGARQNPAAPPTAGRAGIGAAVAAACEGMVDEISLQHVAGWIRNPQEPGLRVDYEAVLSDSGEVLARARADQFKWGLAEHHGFYTRLRRKLDESERPKIAVRPLPGGPALDPAPWLRTAYEPIQYFAMDIVDNCNLRCPFCLYDYADTRATHVMAEATIEAALRFLPYATEGNFWFSCLHEPTLHPSLMGFVDKVPREYRTKLFYTTNLARRMPARYFEWLADTGLHHLNVSVESLDPALYERMRKGARFRIFKANWDGLVDAFARGGAAPRLRYIAMVYKSNLRELPGLVKHLLDERLAAQVELRYTFDFPHIPADFKAGEFLDGTDWIWLRDALAAFPSEKVILVSPPALRLPPPGSGDEADPVPTPPEPRSAGAFLPGRYGFRLSWDGSLVVNRSWAIPYDDPSLEQRLLATNVRDIPDAEAFIAGLPE